MNENDINDKRKQTDFKSITFSKFKRTKVKKELIQNMLDGKIEQACYWCSEYICAGLFIDIWDVIILFMSKYIHTGNPKLPIYIALRIQNFKDILFNGYIDNEIKMRNNTKIRKLFAEVICTLCLSRKKHTMEPVKINKEDDFNITLLSSKLKAPNMSYVNDIFKNDDPKEIFIAANELSYHMSNESNNSFSACYWIEWIIEYENICRRNKENCYVERRDWNNVQDKYQSDLIWIVWDILFKKASKKSLIIVKIINSLYEIFCLKYTNNNRKKRRFVLYFAVLILTENINTTINITNNNQVINNVVSKIDLIYKEVKKNEITPDTNYLFNGLETSSLDKTIKRIEKMNEILGI